MERVDQERFLLKLKGDLNRNRQVLGIVLLGESGRATTRAAVITDSGTPSESIGLQELLSDSRMVELTATTKNGALIVFEDRTRLDIKICALDSIPVEPGDSVRILLDRGGINRLMRSLTVDSGTAPAADRLDVRAAAIRLWDAYTIWQTGEHYPAARMLDRVVDEARGDLGDIDSHTLLNWRHQPLPVVVRDLLGRLASLHPDAGPALLKLSSWIPTEIPQDLAVGSSLTDEAKREGGGMEESSTSGYPSHIPATEAQSPPVIGGTINWQCTVCGSSSSTKGYLYQKGTLNDIRWLSKNAPRMDFKKKVEAHACTACGSISLTLEDQ